MTRCPACNALLYRRRVGETEVDGCPACGGVWLDNGELQALARDPARLRSLDDAIRPGLQPSVAPERTQRCPRCAEPLKEFEYRTLRGVRLDRCAACEGIWLDHGEAGALAAQLLKAEDLLPPAAASEAVAARFGAPRPPSKAAPAAEEPVPAAAPVSTADLPVVRGRLLEGIDHSPGFLGSLERGVRFIVAAYRLAFERPTLLLPQVLGALAQLLFAGIGALWFFSVTRGQLAHDVDVLQRGSTLMVTLGVLAVFFVQLVNGVVAGMTVSMVDAYLKGFAPSLRAAWRDVLQNAGGVAALAVIGTLVEMLTSGGRNGRRGLVGQAVSAAWTAVSFLLMPIVMIEDVGLGRALKRARQIHGKGFVQIAVGEVGLRAIAGLSTFVIAGGAALLAMSAAPAGFAAIALIVAPAAVLLVAVGTLNAFARGAYYTCLYLWAVAIEKAGDPAKAVVPGPLATVLVE